MIKKNTLSQNDQEKLVVLLESFLFESKFQNISNTISIIAAKENDEAYEKGFIENKHLGGICQLSPMALGETVQVWMQAAYNKGIKDGQKA